MNKLLTYRSGSLKDLNQLKQLGIDTYGQYSTILAPEHWERLNYALHDEKGLSELLDKSKTFVCVDHELIVGMAYLIPSGNTTDIYQEDRCYIRMVGVHPLYSGQGIARKLSEMCIEEAKKMNEKTIALHTSEFMDSARHLYASIGFKILKEIPCRLGKRYWLYTLEI